MGSEKRPLSKKHFETKDLDTISLKISVSWYIGDDTAQGVLGNDRIAASWIASGATPN
jgi:hypothetical protein